MNEKNIKIIETIKTSLDKLELTENDLKEYFDKINNIQLFTTIFIYFLLMLNLILSGIILYWIGRL